MTKKLFKDAWKMTPKQYHTARIGGMVQQHGITRQEAMECYPEGSLNNEHFEAVLTAVKAGHCIPNNVLDCLPPGRLHRILHDFPNQHINYMPPGSGKDLVAKTVYEKHGYKDRRDYLEGMAANFDIPVSIVHTLSSMLGPNEDFDGLVNALEDYPDN